MRNWVVNSVLESEKSYIDDLNVLLQVCNISLLETWLVYGLCTRKQKLMRDDILAQLVNPYLLLDVTSGPEQALIKGNR